MKSFEVCQHRGRSLAQRLKNIKIEAVDDSLHLAFILQNSLHLGQLSDKLQTGFANPMLAHIYEPQARPYARLLQAAELIPVPVV